MMMMMKTMFCSLNKALSRDMVYWLPVTNEDRTKLLSCLFVNLQL